MAESAATLTETRTDRRRSVFERLAAWSYRRRWWALALWVLVLVGVTAGAQAVGSDYHNDFSLPGTQSQEAVDTLKRHAPAQAGGTITVVMEHPSGLATPAVKQRVDSMLADIKRSSPHVVDVVSPDMNQGTVSRDGTVGYASVQLDVLDAEMPYADVRDMIATAGRAEGDGLKVALGGEAVRAAEEPESSGGEYMGIFAALVILVILFGSLLAATLPVVIAIFAVGSTVGLVVLASHLASVADFTPPLMMLVGLGVGIDYALLVFSRYRSELVHGADRERAVSIALDTAGRTVFFAACTVVLALIGLVALGLGALQGVALAVALTVLMTMVASLTLLPALLAIFGRRIERRVQRRAAKAKRPEGTAWRRWSEAVQRRPWLSALVALAALLALSIPVLDLRLGFADAGNDDESTSSRQAYDLLARGFGAGFSGPLLVVVDGSQQAAGRLQQALASAQGVAATTPPIPLGSGEVSQVIVFPTTSPQDPATSDLVHRLRDDVLPPLERETGARFLVGGSTAALEDYSETISRRLLLFVLIVIGLSALLLMVVFRSLLIPIKAAILNLLSISAALGVVVLVFQKGALGIQPGPIEAFIPIMIFAIVFGLSMDYEVFLVSRMHEEWQRSHDAPRAIREGMATTGRVVTAAGAIMIVVFGAFVLSPDRMLQQFGLGLAVAIFLDAVVIRCLIVPAVMQLLGARAWWLPRWIDRWLPRARLEHA
ncbi:MAG TPA: MMPL family transporter [Micromonosporaceae bacterium]|nr:MMPL family transporter [Micromonosporaceae bacterium]